MFVQSNTLLFTQLVDLQSNTIGIQSSFSSQLLKILYVISGINDNNLLNFWDFASCFRCRHGANACCLHCSPLEPFDEAYLKEQKIKHMSFHSYLRKLTAGVDRYTQSLLLKVYVTV